jgi:23S rRNA (cytidine2498-2'-O)-methyltransferase
MSPRFYFSTCQIGAEKAVKAEVLSEFPGLRFAFSRPGFITFKDPEGSGRTLAPCRGVFSRLWGEVLGQARDQAALDELAGMIPGNRMLHCFDRDEYLPGDETPGYVRNAHIEGILEGSTIRRPNGRALPGADVYSLVWVDDFLVFLTRHVHSDSHSGFPGNLMPIPLPERSPSRSYLKIEEAILRFHPVLEPGLEALELGCAPGGATTALLDRGLAVTGIDPQYMDARIYARPGFHQVRKPARYLVAQDLRNSDPDWIVMDMNIAPTEALAELSHVLGLLSSDRTKKHKIRHGFFTLKLNDWEYARDIPLYLGRIGQLGFRDLRALQLCHNRREIFVWAPRFSP